MGQINPDKFIILTFPTNSENISFISQTFGITQYVFYDKRFPTAHLINDFSKKNYMQYYSEIREKCLEIEKKDISLTITEFVFFAKTVDFVSKCYLGKPYNKVREILLEDFDLTEEKLTQLIDLYLSKAQKLFEGFKSNCKNKSILEHVSQELDWEIEIF